MPIRLFCSYSHNDIELRKQLDAHLSPLRRANRIEIVWSDDKLTAGTEFDPAIRAELEKADVSLLLLSSNFFNSDYCWNVERRRAFERHDAGEARAVPILAKPCHWQVPPIDKYTVVPRNLKPITSWPNPDEAWAEVIREIEDAIKEREEHNRLTQRPTGQPLTHSGSEEQSPSTTRDDSVFYCVPVWDGPAPLRVEGITELIPDIVLQFRGEPVGRRMADIWLYANTNITSHIYTSNLSEVVLSLATHETVSKLSVLRYGIRAVQNGPNAIVFLHIPLHELVLLPPEERNLRISNVRVNAAMLGVSTKAPTHVAVFLRVSDTTVSPNQLLVGHVVSAFHIDVVAQEPKLDLLHLPRTESLNSGLFTEQRVAEHLSALAVFKGRLAPVEPRGMGTNLQLVFGNVPGGVSIFATTEQVSAMPTGTTAILVSQGLTPKSPSEKPSIDGRVSVGGRFLTLSQVHIDNHVGYAEWEFDAGELEDEQEVAVGIVIAYLANPAEGLPHLGTCLLRASRGPMSTVQTCSTTAPIPRFSPSPTSRSFFSIVRDGKGL